MFKENGFFFDETLALLIALHPDLCMDSRTSDFELLTGFKLNHSTIIF